MQIRKVAIPIHEINGFSLASIHGEISRMYKDVSIGQPVEPPMLTVGVGKVEDGNNFSNRMLIATHEMRIFLIPLTL